MPLQPINRDDVLNIVKHRGPIIPNEIKKVLKQGDTMLLGAMLSELASKGLVKISHTKLGGSPFYYDPAHSERLERIAQHLNEKDLRAYNLLREKRILRDDRQEPLMRVCLRSIKDYAEMLNVQTKEGEHVYWKYYLVKDEEAERLIREQLGIAEKKIEVEQVQQPTPRVEPSSIQAAEPQKDEKDVREQNLPREEQHPLPPDGIDDPFYQRIKGFFDQNKIIVKEQKLIRKGSELEFIILMPTPVGNVEYFSKAKAKKRSSDGDLAAAKLQGHERNLPVLYLTTGEITKKAKDLLKSTFKGLVAKEL